ncbi:MAG: YjbH domain-containing protein [Campylobacterota bacterium]|nr:YjbH domain-containing protein [Campylobacterota bacterium]
MRIVTFILIASVEIFAQTFSTAMSMQGFTGLINTPNAQVLKQGDAVLHFNNQFDNHLRGYDYEKEYSYEEDYIFGIGFLPYLEIQGRLTEARGYIRDLSANAKFQLPFHHKYLPDLAIGVQDIGGAANNYDNTYVVIDKELWFLRASLGYGKADVSSKGKTKRMDGVFGGVEIQALPWLYLIAEDDTREQHAGVRLELPQTWDLPVGVSALVASNLSDEGSTSFAINLTIPLLREEQKSSQTLQNDSENISEEKEDIKAPESVQKPTDIVVETPRAQTLFDLQKSLVDFGFENVRIGTHEKTLHVRCENSIFDKNDIDALGYVIGTIARNDYGYESFSVTLLKSNLETISVGGTVEKYRAFIKDPNALHVSAVRTDLTFSRDFDDSDIQYIGERVNSSFFIPRLELSPGLATAVGTEVGVFDYLLSLRANLYATVYDGLIVSAMAEVPLAHSENFNEGEIYYKMYEDRTEARLVNAMAHQTLHYKSVLNTLSVGLYKTDYVGAMNQTNLTTTSGEHSLRARLGIFENRKYDNDEQRKIYLGSYRYFYAPYDFFIEATYGKYWHQDTGATLELKRYFGDVAVSFIVQDVEDKFAGARVSIPLTTQKLYKADYFQLKGKNDFSYGLRSTISRADGTNMLNPNGGITPLNDFELTSYYLNRDRLNASYVKQHLDRMREVYFAYR